MPTFTDPGTIAFDGVLTRSSASGSSAFVAFPFDVEQLFETRGRVPVTVALDTAPRVVELDSGSGSRCW
jgi:hypothetical protein